jgi:hypothetical protein
LVQVPQFQAFNTTGLEMLYSDDMMATLGAGMRTWGSAPSKDSLLSIGFHRLLPLGGAEEELRA